MPRLNTTLNKTIEHSQVTLLQSKKLGMYQISTYCSDSDFLQDNSQKSYPVIYVLDGNQYFASLVDQLNKLTGKRGFLQHCVLVAIDYPNQTRRDHDYLPFPDSEFKQERLPDGRLNTIPPYGGADDFLAFIENELKPFIARHFPIDLQKQTLCGHSYGGLFTLYALFTQPQLFQSYFAISPSVWFSDRDILHKLDRFLDPAQMLLKTKTRCKISMGEFEQAISPMEVYLSPEKQTWLLKHRQARKMIETSQAIAEKLSLAQLNQFAGYFNFDYTIYAGETHLSAPFRALSDLLYFVLSKSER